MTKAGKKYRVVVVGCGQVGVWYEAESKRDKPASHAGAVRANKATELTAFVDTNKKKLVAAQKLFPGVAGYTSFKECLTHEHPDMVIIATPPAVRLALLKECVRFNVPIVICEKPLAESVREAKQIHVLVGKSGMTFILNYQRRFSPLFARVRASIMSGELGRIQQVTGYYSNGLYSNGGHIVDVLAYLLNDKIVSVRGFKNAMNTTHPAGDVNIDALFTTARGTRIVLQSFDQKKYGIHDVRIYGTKGAAVITDYGITLIETKARASRFVGVQQLDAARSHFIRVPLSATKEVLTQAIDCYEKHRVPASSVASGLSVVRVLDAIAKSAKHQGTSVALP